MVAVSGRSLFRELWLNNAQLLSDRLLSFGNSESNGPEIDFDRDGEKG